MVSITPTAELMSNKNKLVVKTLCRCSLLKAYTINETPTTATINDTI